MHQRVLPKTQEILDARNEGISRKMVKGSQDAFCTKCMGVSVSKFMALVSPWESPLWTWPQLPGAEWPVVSSPPVDTPALSCVDRHPGKYPLIPPTVVGENTKSWREALLHVSTCVYMQDTQPQGEKVRLAGWFPMRGTGWRKQSMVRGSYFRHLSLFPFECVPKPLWILQLKLKTLKFLKN